LIFEEEEQTHHGDTESTEEGKEEPELEILEVLAHRRVCDAPASSPLCSP
jgi:hypothetical protein